MSSSAGLARPAGGRVLVSLGSEHLALRPVPTPQHAAPGGNRTTVGVGDRVNEAPSEPKAHMRPGQGRSLRGRRLLLPTQGRGEGSLDEHAEETASQAFS